MVTPLQTRQHFYYIFGIIAVACEALLFYEAGQKKSPKIAVQSWDKYKKQQKELKRDL